jgi:hypothetical protein
MAAGNAVHVCAEYHLRGITPHLTNTNDTAEPGTMVVGRAPFQRLACISVTRFGLVPGALARASMAAASTSPVTRSFARVG